MAWVQGRPLPLWSYDKLMWSVIIILVACALEEVGQTMEFQVLWMSQRGMFESGWPAQEFDTAKRHDENLTFRGRGEGGGGTGERGSDLNAASFAVPVLRFEGNEHSVSGVDLCETCCFGGERIRFHVQGWLYAVAFLDNA